MHIKQRILILLLVINGVLYAEFNEDYKLTFFNFEAYKRFSIYNESKISADQKFFSVTLGSMLITSFFFDQSIRDFTQNKLYNGSNLLTDVMYRAGDPESIFYVFFALHSADFCLQDAYYHETLLLSLQSLAVTQSITEGFKKSFKRSRPRHSPNDPFNFWVKGQSFFSGHSSGAWAYFTVLATRHPEFEWFSYGFATCVSLSRVYEDAHWTSDILMGAFVGYTIGKWTSKLKMGYIPDINVLPYVDCDGKFVVVQWKFY